MSICAPCAQHSAPCRLLCTTPPCTAPRTRLCTARRRCLCHRHPRPLSGSCIRHTARRCTLQSAQPWHAHVPRMSRRRRRRRRRCRRRRTSMAQHGTRRGPGRRRDLYMCNVHVRHRGPLSSHTSKSPCPRISRQMIPIDAPRQRSCMHTPPQLSKASRRSSSSRQFA